MHIINEMLTLMPQSGLATSMPSQTTVTSPMMSIPAEQYNAFQFSSIPPGSISCLQAAAALSGISLQGQSTTMGGYALAGVPTNCGLTSNGLVVNGVNALNGTPANTCSVSGCTMGAMNAAGMAMNNLPAPPPTALTAPEVYGLPPPSMTSSEKKAVSSDSSSSGGTSPAPLSPAASMELVWHGEFDRLFAQYFPHMWCLVPTFYPPSDRWRTFKDSAKVRFSCQDCGHGWTSMKGRVVFWFELNYATNAGCVMFKLYGQQCQRCKTGKFEHAMWYPEEVVKVIGNVYNRVGQIYYGFVRPPLRIDRRVGKPRNQHNAELCQACKEGLCREEWSFA